MNRSRREISRIRRKRPSPSAKRRSTQVATTLRGLRLESLEDRRLLATLGLDPAITGIVFEDLDGNGQPAAAERVEGATVQLFQDDGDGLLAPGAGDVLIDTTVTDAGGVYCFESLSASAGYFVRQPAQTVGTFVLPTRVSGLLQPGQPVRNIDEFETQQSAVAGPGAPDNDGTQLTFPDESEVIGRQRDLFTQLTSGVGEVRLQVNPFGTENVLQFDITAGVSGVMSVTWDGIDNVAGNPPALNLGGRDLTQGGRNYGLLLMLGVDQPGTDLRLDLFQGNTTTPSTVVVTIPVTGGSATGELIVPFGDFVGPVSAANVDAIRMSIESGNAAINGRIDLVGILGPAVHNFVNTVPVDLSITKTDGQTSAVPGLGLTYTIVVANQGDTGVVGARVVDTFSTNLLNATYTSVTTGTVSGNTASGSGNIDDTVSMTAGSTITYTVTGTVRPGATGILSNTATVSPPTGVEDEDPADNTSTDTTTLTPQADLTITKTDNRRTVLPGQSTQYTIVVRNLGPSHVTGATVSDLFPGLLQGVSFTSTAAGGASGNIPSGMGNIVDVVTIPVNGSITYVVSATVRADARGTLENTATVTAPSGVTDLVEGNNTATDETEIITPIVLGSQPVVTLNDQLLGTDEVNLFRITAHDTGKLIVNALFAHALGDIDLSVLDENGNLIAGSFSVTDNEQVIIPVVSQESYILALANQGGAAEVTTYDLEIENFAAPVPSAVHLDPASDTGMMNNDNVTGDTTPRLLIQADLADFAAMGIPLLTAAEATAANTPGAAVQVFLTNSTTGEAVEGFASRLGTSTTLFEFTPAGALPDGIYFGSAAVRIFDGQQDGEGDPDPATGRAQLSVPLWFTIDTTAPAGTAPQLLSSSDSGQLNSDSVTSKMQPAFRGLGEANAKVRVFADGLLVAQGVVGSDLTDGVAGNNQGAWELTVEPLVDGSYEFVAVYEDAAGNIGTAETTTTVVVDTQVPNTPYLDLLNDTGHSTTDQITGATRLSFLLIGNDTLDGGANPAPNDIWYRLYWRPGSGAGEVLVYDSLADLGGFTSLGQLNVTVSQTLNDPAGTPFPSGSHNFKLEIEDRAGNVSPDFLLQLEIDAGLAGMPTIDLLASSDSGMSSSDNVTAIQAPALSGIAEANSIVRVFARNVATNVVQLVGQGVVGSDLSDVALAGTTLGGVAVSGEPDDGLGLWEVTVEPLADAVYDFFAELEDWAGNVVASGTLRVEIDTLTPNTPYLDLVAASDTGRNNADDVTSDTTLTLTMTSEDRTANPADYSHLIAENFKYRIFVRPDGALGQAESLIYDSATDGGLVLVNGLTGLMFLERTMAALPAGVHNLKLEVEDRAGNISADFLLTVTIDATAFLGDVNLAADSDSGVWGYAATLADRITRDSLPSFFGVAEANNLVTVAIDGVPVGTTVAVPLDGNNALQPPNPPYNNIEGNWRIDSQANLSDGEHSVVVTFEDQAGNRVSTAPLLIFVDTQGPKITNVTAGQVSENGEFSFDGVTSLFEPKPSGGPDPLISSIVVSFQDGPARTASFPYAAVFSALALEEGNYRLVGDANGHIPILEVVLRTNFTGPGPARAEYELIFHDPGPDGILYTADDAGAPLPDDRFTLWVSDRIQDVAGNALDGESGASAPFEGNDAPASTPPIFPTGDGQHGGEFEARFTVDSRAEIGVWAAGSVWVDTNGNFHFDPENIDSTNRDVVYTQGFTSDDVFAGNFSHDPGEDGVLGTTDDGPADGFHKLAAYGRVGGSFRWLIDTDNDGDPDLDINPAGSINGLPVAGRFDSSDANGDEVGLFDGSQWHFDTNHDFQLDTTLSTSMTGYPIVGDFDGDGFDDLGTWTDDRFQIDVADGVRRGWDGVADMTFWFGFIGVRERPVAGDFNGDGIDDLGLLVPDREGVTPRPGNEWYLLLSGDTSGFFDAAQDGVPGTVSVLDRVQPAADPVDGIARSVEFNPAPFGRDLYAQFGDEYALPVVGNFDPPTSATRADDEAVFSNPADPLDVNNDGLVSPIDALLVINDMNRHGARSLSGSAGGVPYVDVNGDRAVSPIDALLVINAMNEPSRVASSAAQVVAAAGTEGEGEAPVEMALVNSEPAATTARVVGAEAATGSLRLFASASVVLPPESPRVVPVLGRTEEPSAGRSAAASARAVVWDDAPWDAERLDARVEELVRGIAERTRARDKLQAIDAALEEILGAAL